MLIEIQDLVKLYDMGASQVNALDGVDLEIARGEYVAIMGPSGSGKSTLMNLIGCLDTPTAGTYVLNGTEVVSKLDDNELAADPQQGDRVRLSDVQPAAAPSALQNVELPLIYAGVPRARAAPARARRCSERWGWPIGCTTSRTSCRADSDSAWPSRGALVNNPSILLADEPTGNLDTRTGEEIMQMFEDLTRRATRS